MKNLLRTTILIGLIVATMIVSCRKNQLKDPDGSLEDRSLANLTVGEAKLYHQAIAAKQGDYDLIKIQGKTEKISKSVDFSQPYIGENETSFFVEVPITYSKRVVAFTGRPGMPTAILKKMLANSFDRLVISKDKTTGFVSEKIVTIIPSAAYSTEDRKGLYNNNHYQSMAEGFSGIVSYKSWKGQLLSSQSYNPDIIITEGVKFGVDCATYTVYVFFAWCEDYDADGWGINCDWTAIDVVDIYICAYDGNENLHNHPLPPVNDSYWSGFPDPQNIPTATACPGTPRVLESPIMYSGALGSAFSMTLYDACFCQGYSWVIFEDIATGVEYPVPIANQTFLMTGCTAMWKTTFTIPTNIPNGDYFTKVYLDGDVFYHQFQQDGIIIKRFKQTILR
jgi:hypothetical protein